jgi:hypothetical protein
MESGMTAVEFLALPEMDPKKVKVGEKFRWTRSVEKELVPGDLVIYFEVINVTDRGYEAIQRECILM